MKKIRLAFHLAPHWRSYLIGFLSLAVAHIIPTSAQAGVVFAGPASHNFYWYADQQSSARVNPLQCDLAVTDAPDCFYPHTTPTVRVFFMQYGTYSTVEDLKRVGALLAKRFAESTDNALQIEFVDYAVVPLAQYPRDLSALRAAIKGDAEQTSDERLTRIWYYYNKAYNGDDSIVQEIQQQVKKAGYNPELSKADAILVLSETQFEGLGYASGGFGIVEQPTEIAWAANGGSTQKYTDAQLADELLHELGHVLGLDHAAKECLNLPSARATLQCCQNSPGGQDVMSYCRDRSKVNDTFYYTYTQCTRDYLKTVTAPALLNGGPRVFQPTNCP